MFSYNLTHNEKKESITYAPSRSLRAISLFFALVLGYFFILSILEGSYSASALIPLFCAIILFITTIYRDSWTFSKQNEMVYEVFGFGPFVTRKTYPFSSIRRISLTHFLRGTLEERKKQSKRIRAQIVLSIEFNDSRDRKDLEIMGERQSGGKLEAIARSIAAFTSLELFIDREREYPVDLKSWR